MNRRNTLEDVAKAAGVGKVTVSYVLNGRSEKARISDATRQRVLSVARELDYRPNALARMLQNRQTDSVAVVFQYGDYFRASSGFVSELMRGVCGASFSSGVDVLLHTKPATDMRAEADALSDGRVDGALILRDANDPIVSLLHSRNFPMVMFFCRSADATIPFVDTDNFIGGQLAVGHLWDLGHRRIAMIRGSLGSMASNDRHQGYRHEFEARGATYDASLVIQNENSEEFRALMRSDRRPTAIFAWSDDVAFGCIRILTELGLSVPQDVSVVGFDSTTACEQVSPRLTSVAQPVASIAAAATNLLVDLVRKKVPEGAQTIIFPPTLDVRGSTAPPAILN